LDDVDAIQNRIKEMIDEIRAEEKNNKLKKKQEKESSKQQEVEKEDPLRESKEEKIEEPEQKKDHKSIAQQHKELWKRLKLSPKFQTTEYADAYVVAAYIPGMNNDDVELSLGKNATLEIKGVRYPTPHEEAIMMRQLGAYRQRSTHGHIHPSEENEILGLLRIGAGRYGSFSQTFSLPRDADVNNINASYEGGTVKVIIPRVRPQRRPVAAPFSAMGARRAGFPGFFEDEDSWW
jgi:HSP20 family molecular chaperone IbpA